MIRGFEPGRPPEPAARIHFQWTPAIGAGLIAGAVLLVLPHGTPWSGATFFHPTVMGRPIPGRWGMTVLGSSVIHLAISAAYGVVISLIISGLVRARAIIAGGLIGMLLYLVNFGVVATWIPELRGNELSIFMAHLVFGLISGAAYRGLLRRRPAQMGAS